MRFNCAYFVVHYYAVLLHYVIFLRVFFFFIINGKNYTLDFRTCTHCDEYIRIIVIIIHRIISADVQAVNTYISV